MPIHAIDNTELATEQSRCPAMQAIEAAIAQIAPTNIPILLIGASGTGKEFVAQQIHRLFSRHNGPLAKVICASSGDASFATYFGNIGNHNDYPENHPRTLFLKEIGELDPVSQRNLLYALPEADGDPSGSHAGPRLISSTALDLEEEIRQGRFRAELYYRISGVILRLPALRQRKEDIPELVEFFLTKHTTMLGRTRPYLDAEDFALLQKFWWPGNIRELENTVKTIVILNNPKIVIGDLITGTAESLSVADAASGSVLKAATQAASRGAERQLILEALSRTRWNRKRAAQELQISYKSLLYKIKRIGADEPDVN